MEGKKFYWLKLKRDFFKRHDIRIIEGMTNGREISLFYIKLMLESVDHDGELRFSETIPYTPEMLSTITFTDLETVKRGLEVLESFGLLVQTEDGTLKLPKVVTMIDSASDSDEARRQRRCREQKRSSVTNCHDDCDKTSQQALQNVTDTVTNRHESKSKSKRQIKSKSKSVVFTAPTLEEVMTYCKERGNRVDAEKFIAYYESKGWFVGKTKMKNWKAAVISWEKNDFDGPKKRKQSGWRTGAEAGIVSMNETKDNSDLGAVPNDVLDMFGN